ncbi:hypothetical protein TNCV_4621881 [Trichonephila clavipes]|nr:hypothetical protein TNCV_4621881 [Trichonephila clavipes]
MEIRRERKKKTSAPFRRMIFVDVRLNSCFDCLGHVHGSLLEMDSRVTRPPGTFETISIHLLKSRDVPLAINTEIWKSPSSNQSPSCHSAKRKTPLLPCPASKTCHDMGLRTVFTVQMPKKKRLFNAYSPLSLLLSALLCNYVANRLPRFCVLSLSGMCRPVFVVSDTGHRKGKRNVRCDLTSGWGESYK